MLNRRRLPWIAAVSYGAVLAVLVSAAPRRTVGDGVEYLAYAMAISYGDGPALADGTIARMVEDARPFDPAFAEWLTTGVGRPASDGRIDFLHFWLYPALAAPWVAAALNVGLDPRLGFGVLNIGLLVIAFAVGHKHVGWAPTLLVLAGPIIWWSDKAHPEVFIVALMAIALSVWPQRPGLALVACAFVGAQVPPFAVFVPIVALAAIRSRPGVWRARSFQIASILAALILLLPTIYYLGRFGTPSLLTEAARYRWPSMRRLTAVLFDLNIGLFPNWPLLGVAMIVGADTTISRPGALRRYNLALVLTGTAVLLFAFTQIGNFMHGATPGIIRYAVWLSPLAIPLVASPSRARWLLGLLAVASALLSLVRYNPAVEEFAHRPSAVALWVWKHAPSLSHPSVEIFVRSLDQHARTLPMAAPGCHKVLLVGRGEAQGMWPRPCPPFEVTDECREPGTLCYANRSDRAYGFDRIAGRDESLKYDPSSVWPRAAERGVLRAMAQVAWWSLREPESASRGVIASVSEVRVEHVFSGADRHFLILIDAMPGARIEIRTSGTLRIMVVDGETGAVLPPPPIERTGVDTQSVRLPTPHRILVVNLWSSPS